MSELSRLPVQVKISGARGALGIDFDTPPTPGQFLAKAAGTNDRKFVSLTGATPANAVALTDLAKPTGGALVGYARPESGALGRQTRSVLDQFFATPADFSVAVNDDDLIDALLGSAAGTIRIPRRATAYSLSRTHVVPAGKTVLFDGYTTIVWAGINDSTLRGVFDVSAAGIKIGVYGTGKVAFSCATAAPFVYAFIGYASVALSIADVSTLNMSAVFVSANAGSYAAVVTPKMRAAGDARPLNIVQGPEITGCSVLFSVTQGGGNGGIYLGYTFDGIVTDCHVNGANQGIQWWGGNANRSVDGALANERKCQNNRIRMCSAANIGGGGIWGSMGQNNRVENSDVTIAGDVGFDDEGGIGNKFVACAARESAHGNYTVFFDSQNTQIINCNSYQSDASKPHLRTYNSALDGIPSGLAVDGGLWETAKEAGRPGMLDAANGPNRVVIIRNIKGINTAITLNTNNRNITTIENNDLAFPYLSSVAFTAIYLDGAHTVTSSDGAPVAAQEIVRSNRVYTDYAQPTNTYAILLRVGDFNNIVTAEVSGNILSSGANVWWGEILFTSTGTNPGNPPHCIARDNRLSTVSTGLINIGFNAASGAVAPVQHLGVNTNRYGVPLS